LKLAVELSGSGANGFDVEHDLRADGVILEHADRTVLVALLTIGDDEISVGRLIASLRRSLAQRAGTDRAPAVPASSWRIVPHQVMTPREAFFAPRERVPAKSAGGRVSAEIVSPYPPGIPALAPGELVTPELVEMLRTEAHLGTRMAGASDASLDTLVVVRA
jgi:lysine decarboxylase